jgi:cullin-associated NEDD8-dissociated protein 1
MLLAPSKGVRKKATNCLGQFAIVLSQRQLQKLIAILVERLNKSDNKVDLLTQLQCISQISRCVGGKLGQNYEQLFTKLVAFPVNLRDDTSEDIDNELAEASLLSIENLIRKCPDNAVPTLNGILKLTSEAITYDPNYNYAEDDEMENDEDMEDGGWDEYDGEDEQIDADDTAWKVRKSAVKVIDAVIVSCPGHLRDFWIQYIELLQSRFIERDDNVKCDIL